MRDWDRRQAELDKHFARQQRRVNRFIGISAVLSIIGSVLVLALLALLVYAVARWVGVL